MRYDAFVSYNHGEDGGIAPYLQEALQRIAMPWYRRRGMQVFRDYTDLPADADLGASIEAALDDSRYYILIASPGSRDSKWVGQEIDHWLATKTAARKRMVLVLTDGTIRLDDEKRIDYAKSTALHEQMRGRFDKAPLYIDLTTARQKIDAHALSRRQFRREYRHEIALVAAKVKECEVREVIDDDVRFQHRKLMLAWSAAAMLLVLTVLAVLGLLSAQRNADEARAQTAKAESGELAARSGALRATDAPEALAVAVAASRHASSPLARNSLVEAAKLPVSAVFGPSGAEPPTGSWTPSAVTLDGRTAATAARPAPTVVIHETATGTRAALVDDVATRADALAFSPDGTTLAVGYAAPYAGGAAVGPPPGRVVLWDVASRKALTSWDTTGAVSALAYSPDGSRIVTGTAVGQVERRDADGRDPVLLASLPNAVGGAAFAPDGTRVAVSTVATDTIGPGSGRVRVLDVLEGTEVTTFDPASTNVGAVAYTPDGSQIVSGDDQGRVMLWDTASGRLVETWNGDADVLGLAVNPAGTLLASADSNGAVTVRSLPSGEVIASWSDGNSVRDVAFARGGSEILTGDDRGRLVVREVRRLSDEIVAQSVVGFTHTGEPLIRGVGSVDGPLPSVDRWDPVDHSAVPLPDAPNAYGTVVSRDGTTIASTRSGPPVTDADGTRTPTTVVVDRLPDGQAAARIELDDSIGSIALSGDGSALVTLSGGFDASGIHEVVSVWDTATGHRLRDWRFDDAQSTITALTVDGAGETVAAHVGERTVLFAVKDGKRRELPRDDGGIARVDLSNDGRWLTESAYDGPVRLWDLRTMRSAIVGSPAATTRALAFSPDSRRVAVADDQRRTTLWDLRSRRAVHQWTTAGAVEGLTITPDSRTLALDLDTDRVQLVSTTADTAPDTTFITPICRVLRGYRPPPSQWNADVPYLRYRELCQGF